MQRVEDVVSNGGTKRSEHDACALVAVDKGQEREQLGDELRG